jgi:hypothetical protein
MEEAEAGIEVEESAVTWSLSDESERPYAWKAVEDGLPESTIQYFRRRWREFGREAAVLVGEDKHAIGEQELKSAWKVPDHEFSKGAPPMDPDAETESRGCWLLAAVGAGAQSRGGDELEPIPGQVVHKARELSRSHVDGHVKRKVKKWGKTARCSRSCGRKSVNWKFRPPRVTVESFEASWCDEQFRAFILIEKLREKGKEIKDMAMACN